VIFFKRLLCRHRFSFVRNIYGDEIIEWNWKRSLWRCDYCSKLQARPDLFVTKEAP